MLPIRVLVYIIFNSIIQDIETLCFTGMHLTDLRFCLHNIFYPVKKAALQGCFQFMKKKFSRCSALVAVDRVKEDPAEQQKHDAQQCDHAPVVQNMLRGCCIVFIGVV